MSYVALKRDLSPTAAAVKIFNDLSAANGNVINLGQGREIDDPDGKLGELLSAELKTTTKYNADTGGPETLRKTAGEWVSRFLGLPANSDNTFVLQQLGRESLGYAMGIAAHPHRGKGYIPAMLVPETRWPVVNDKLDDEGMAPLSYPVARENFAAPLEDLIKNAGEQVIAAAYFNFPHNPTSLEISDEENTKIMAVLEEANKNGKEIIRIDDLPYFGNCEQKNDGAFLKMGYEGVFTGESITKWACAISFSKALGTAQPGLSILVCHPELSDKLSKRLTRSSALAYVPQFFDNIGKILSPDMDKDVLAHFAGLRAKYIENRKYAETAFGENIVNGDPGMTSLVRVSKDAFGKNVTCSDGQNRPINDLNDVIEFLANEGVVTVNNGHEDDGTGLLRIAQAQHPDNFKKGIEILQAGLDKIKNAPSL